MTWTQLVEEELEGGFKRSVHAYQIDTKGCLVMTTMTAEFTVSDTGVKKDIPISMTTQWVQNVMISGSELVAMV